MNCVELPRPERADRVARRRRAGARICVVHALVERRRRLRARPSPRASMNVQPLGRGELHEVARVTEKRLARELVAARQLRGALADHARRHPRADRPVRRRRDLPHGVAHRADALAECRPADRARRARRRPPEGVEQRRQAEHVGA
jgi:hypothetical protein